MFTILIAQILWFAWFVFDVLITTKRGEASFLCQEHPIFLWRLFVSLSLLAKFANAYQYSSIIRCNG